jgi:D-galactose 1-dehydrogenase
MTALRVAIVGFGKIASDQHVPAIAATDGVTLAAIASRRASLPDLPHFTSLADAAGLPIEADFDFRQTGQQSWDIVVEAEGGPLKLSAGVARLVAGGEVLVDAAEAEYRGLYRRFVELTAHGTSDVDLTPLRLVADALMLGRRRFVEAFEE